MYLAAVAGERVRECQCVELDVCGAMTQALLNGTDTLPRARIVACTDHVAYLHVQLPVRAGQTLVCSLGHHIVKRVRRTEHGRTGDAA